MCVYLSFCVCVRERACVCVCASACAHVCIFLYVRVYVCALFAHVSADWLETQMGKTGHSSGRVSQLRLQGFFT